MHAPTTVHLDAVYRIFRYLKHNPGAGLLYSRRSHLHIEGYTNADWAGFLTDRHSTFGYCTFVGGNLVTWRSKKQFVVARFNAEAKFQSMAHDAFTMIIRLPLALLIIRYNMIALNILRLIAILFERNSLVD